MERVDVISFTIPGMYPDPEVDLFHTQSPFNRMKSAQRISFVQAKPTTQRISVMPERPTAAQLPQNQDQIWLS